MNIKFLFRSVCTVGNIFPNIQFCSDCRKNYKIMTAANRRYYLWTSPKRHFAKKGFCVKWNIGEVKWRSDASIAK